jgi:hypothetical protein
MNRNKKFESTFLKYVDRRQVVKSVNYCWEENKAEEQLAADAYHIS